jgi:hypothetical protein
VRGFKKSVNEGEEEERAPPRQIRSDGSDADFVKVATARDASPKSDRGG